MLGIVCKQSKPKNKDNPKRTQKHHKHPPKSDKGRIVITDGI